MKNECIVYLDSFVKNENATYTAYVDFRNGEDLRLFEESNGRNNREHGFGSYLELRGFRSRKRLRSGCYYRLNLRLLNRSRSEINENSYVVGRVFDFAEMEMPTRENQELLQKHGPLEPDDFHLLHAGVNFEYPDINGQNLKLLVRNVNQANWNELLENDTVKIVFDFGARKNATKAEVQQVFNGREHLLRRDKPVLVISHWDIDHIHCLCNLNIGDLCSHFSKFIGVNAMRGYTAKRVSRLLVCALGVQNSLLLTPCNRTNGINMHLDRRVGAISLYVGEKSSKSNYCGLGMFVRGNDKSVNFTGDIRLAQANSVLAQENGVQYDRHILIAPHHGGDNKPKYRNYQPGILESIISVGANNQPGHPNPRMLAYLQGISGTVKRTDIDGDVVEVL